ncbi:hypothetical protein CYL31_12390 [Marinomonas sp. A3A]|jgi:alpha-ketoglutarate-dependent taurine dioxygenase|uniref:TauD/TfdA family dioxygenase n=1 Tax=Marinomonas sp. A3A TaxID=2065312 RepID=UPI001BB3E01D|nr:TauD/TfdA family dioxygenase [Marinomonas sp. A3A]QUX92160.1 hypothetical protein CYL31_12390 [Marinomonas sp. A3A]
MSVIVQNKILTASEGACAVLPHIISLGEGRSWRDSIAIIHREVENHLLKSGGLLFRGGDLLGEAEFQEFAKTFGFPLLDYEFGSTPRTDLGEGVYTTTEYPAHQVIPLHNEQAYTLNWPMKIWFHCIEPAHTEGETPIADSRKVYQRIPVRIRERFAEKKLMYVRNYGNGLDLPWEKVFSTEDPKQVEAFCRQNQIDFEWKGDGELRTRQICQSVAQHPITQEWVWFNQAHLFHVSNLDAHIRETLLSIVEEEDLPRNVYYGDGTPIEDSVLDEIRGVLDSCMVKFPWQKGDVLMLDNMLVAHARSRFSGPRKVVVAMAEPNK